QGVETMIGLFINTLPVRLLLEEDRPAAEWLGQVQEEAAGLQAFEATPLPEIQRWSGVAAGRSLFETLLVVENHPVDRDLQGRHGELVVRDARTLGQSSYPLNLEVVPGEELELGLAYSRRRFDATTVERMMGSLLGALEALVEAPERALGGLPLLSPAQRHQLTLEWGEAPAAALPEGGWKPLHERIAAWAESRAAAPALGCRVGSEEGSWSHGELDRRVATLGALLQEAGVEPGDRVGLCLERGAEVVAATLAVFAAGGVFVPLDPSYPPERLRFMVEDSGTRLVLTERALRERLPEEVSCRLLDGSDAERAEAAERGSCFVPAVLGPESPAYMIYTSGTTGRPKGV
ncbi:MAG: AMP-binding protein, partial [Acidobacteria bacterium]|nr:AMP-binding protein [Acidobacteriota bacterium]